MRPDPSRYNPSPARLRRLVKRARLNPDAAARAIGVSRRAMFYYLSDGASHRAAPYHVQFALEALALNPAAPAAPPA